MNLSTGEVTRLHERTVPIRGSGRWHDVDRIDEHRLVVADIHRDRVVVVNHTNGLETWSWDAQTDYTIESGESEVHGGRGWPGDWTHVNDVEVLANGRIMASLRNQDQVVFLDRETGRVDGWTLGSDGDHETLYEQHNPDYIPEERGGPAVVVSDSENGRVVEYQREGDGWTKSWEWSDDRMQWPRDADRLPNGNTLVTDTHGGRVIEVDATGDVVWQIDVVAPYEAERFETGPESAGGRSADDAGLDSQVAGSDAAGEGPLQRISGTIWGAVSGFVPSLVLNGVLYVIPVWMGLRDVFAVLLLVGTVTTWSVVEFWLSPWYLTTRWPVEGFRAPVTLSRDDR